MERSERKTGAMLSYVSIIVSTIVQLIYTPFLIKMLGQSEYGLYSLIASIIGSLTVLDLGFGNAIIVYTAKYRANNQLDKERQMQGMFKIVFYIIGFIIGIMGLILFFNTDLIFSNTMTNNEIEKAKIMMLILSFNLIITFVFNIYSSIISAYEKFVFQKVMSIINTILKPIFMIPLLFLGYKSIEMCIIITIINIIVVLSNYFYCKNKLNIKIKFMGFDKKLFLEMFGYSFFIFLGVIVDKINWSVDQFVLGAVSGTVAVSLYSAASQINVLFINLANAINGIMLPKMSKLIAKNASDDEITTEFIKIGRIQYLLIFLMASGFTLFGKEFFIAWLGEEYVSSYYVALILILPLCIPLIQSLGISIMQAKNMHKFRSILYAMIAVANVAISIPLAKKFGEIGSAIGTAISLIIGNGIIINYYYYKKVGINIFKFWKEILVMTIPNVLPILMMLLIKNFVTIHGFKDLIMFGAMYTIMYGIICYFLSMNQYERQLVNQVIKKGTTKGENL